MPIRSRRRRTSGKKVLEIRLIGLEDEVKRAYAEIVRVLSERLGLTTSKPDVYPSRKWRGAVRYYIKCYRKNS